MEKIDLLEKLVEVQEMYIELMNDFNNLKISYEAFKEENAELYSKYLKKSTRKGSIRYTINK